MRQRMNKNLKLVVVAIAVVMIATSFAYVLPNNHGGGAQTSATPATSYNLNATFEWGRTSFVDYLNPFNTHYMTTQTIMEMVYPALCYWSANMSVLVPYLATSWDINYANHTALFYLNHNAKWSDGTPITANDVVYSFNMYKQPWTHENSWFKSVTSTTAIGNYTVKITFTGLSFIYIALPQVIVPEHIWNDSSIVSNVSSYSGFTSGSSFVGGGPFLMANYTPNADIELVRNANFWDSNYTAHFSKLIVKDYTSDSTLLAGLESGEISEAYIDSTILPAALNATNLKVSQAPSTIDDILQFNQYPNGTGNPALLNQSFRYALAYALNISYLIQLGYKGYATPTVGLVPPGNPYYNTYLSPWPYNVAKADQILSNLGYKNGSNGYRTNPNGTALKLTYTIPSGATTWIDLAATMIQEWKAIGINVVSSVVDTATLESMSDHYTYDIQIGDWFSDANYGSELYTMTQSQLHIYANAPGYNNTEYSDLYNNMTSATSVSAAISDAMQMQNLTYWNMTFLGLWCPSSLIAYQKQLTNVPSQYAGMVPQYGYGWWILLDPYFPGSTTTPASTGGNILPYIIVAVVVIAIVGAGIGVYVRSRKKN